MRIYHFHYHQYDDSKLDLIINKLNKIMATEQDFLTALGRIDTATNNIAADLRALADQIENGGLSQSVEDAVLAKLDAAATTLEAVAATTPDGEPTPEPPAEPPV